MTKRSRARARIAPEILPIWRALECAVPSAFRFVIPGDSEGFRPRGGQPGQASGRYNHLCGVALKFRGYGRRRLKETLRPASASASARRAEGNSNFALLLTKPSKLADLRQFPSAGSRFRRSPSIGHDPQCVDRNPRGSEFLQD